MARTESITEQLLVRPGEAARLDERDPAGTLGPEFEHLSERALKKQAQTVLQRGVEDLAERQELLYASNTHALLVVLQGLDASGKDSTIKHVMSGVNPQGVRVTSFKQPTSKELAHDFLWRIARKLPELGSIGIFNRSHYEEVTAVRVHPEWLDLQRLPPGKRGDRFWEKRFASINEFEHHLHRNGTKVVKLFLHISKEEQKRRLLTRLSSPKKAWKFDAADIEEREHWEEYMAVYESAITATSTRWAPWYVLPADHKPITRALVARLLAREIDELTLSYPALTAEQRATMEDAQRVLEAEPG